MSFEAFKATTQAQTQQVLKQYLAGVKACPRLAEAMRYSSLSGGKRIRAMLVYATGEVLGVDKSELDVVAAALEMIHAFSLIHDDLPAMDDDDLRRGLPTCHLAFDEAVAILAGDALHTFAFELLSNPELSSLSAEVRLKLIYILTAASGSNGMVAGQAIDVLAEGAQLTLEQQQTMHQLKTGRLIEASVLMVLEISAWRDDAKVGQSLYQYAHKLGLAFQIQDDILDQTSNTQALGKTVQRDLALNKATYPSIIGLDGAKRLANQCYNQALAQLKCLPNNTKLLKDLAHYMVYRES